MNIRQKVANNGAKRDSVNILTAIKVTMMTGFRAL